MRYDSPREGFDDVVMAFDALAQKFESLMTLHAGDAVVIAKLEQLKSLAAKGSMTVRAHLDR